MNAVATPSFTLAPATAKPQVVARPQVFVYRCPTCGREHESREELKYGASTCAGSFTKPHKPAVMQFVGKRDR